MRIPSELYTYIYSRTPLLDEYLVPLELGRRRQHSADSRRDLDAHQELFQSETSKKRTRFSQRSTLYFQPEVVKVVLTGKNRNGR